LTMSTSSPGADRVTTGIPRLQQEPAQSGLSIHRTDSMHAGLHVKAARENGRRLTAYG